MNNKNAFLFAAVGNRSLVQGALLTIVFALLLALPLCAGAQTPAVTLAPTINTVAGNYSLGAGYTGDSLAPTAATLNSPKGIAFDPLGNLYIADTKNNVVRQVNAATQTITTFAGTGAPGYGGDNGPAIGAQLAGPTGVASDAAGNIYIADSVNNVVRRVDVLTQNITTVAGGGTPASGNGDGGPATSATLSGPRGVVVDAYGNLYIADFGNNEIRRVDFLTNKITKFAGGGTPASGIGDGGLATAAVLSGPSAVALDANGNIYISDTNHNVVRQVNANTLIIATVAGNYLLDPGYSGDTGLATGAQLNKPTGLVFDAAGNLYISDQSNEVVRAVNPATQMIVTVAGNNALGLGFSGDSGVAISAQLYSPAGLAVDLSGNLYIADANNNVIREVNAVKGSIKFPATGVLAVSGPQNLVLQLNAAVTISSVSANASQGPAQEYVAGTVTGCATDGVTGNPAGSYCTVPVTFNPAYAGERDVPLTVVTSAGNFNFGLSGIGTGSQVALIPGTITTVAGTAPAPVFDRARAVRALKSQFKANALARRRAVRPADAPATGVSLNFPNGVAVDSASNLYIADLYNLLVWKVDASGNATVMAGGGNPASGNGDGGPAINAQLVSPSTVAVDGAGNLYIADTASIRKVDASTGYISTVAGGGIPSSGNGDGGPATNATLSLAYGVAVDRSGNIYIADFGDALIRKVDANTGYISTVAGNGNNDYTVNSVPASSALLNQPYGVSVDSLGNYYISDDGDSVVRKVDASTGLINTIVGSGQSGYAGDGGLAINAQVNSVGYTAVDAAGNLYLPDYGNNVIRKVDAGTQIINTIAGNSNGGYGGDLGSATSATLWDPDGVAVDSVGNLYIADSGNNLVREVTASAAPLIFPTSTAVGSIDATDGAQTVTVSNIGNQSLTFASNVLVSSAVVSGSTCPLSLPVGTTCAESIEFDPASSGAVSGYVSLVDNALNAVPPANTQTIVVNGTGTGTASASFSISGPSTTVAGTSQSFIVTALAGTSGTNAAYLGTVHFTSTDVIAILPADYTFTSADNGVHTFNVALETAGIQTVTVTDTTTSLATGTSNTVIVSAGPAAQVTAVSGSGQSAVIDAAFTSPLTVMVTDAYGNPVADTPVTLTAPTSGASATLGSGTVTTDINGTASTTATANGIAGSYGVTASIHGLTPAIVRPSRPAVQVGNQVTFSLTNSKAPNTSVALTSSSSTAYFGQTLTFTAKATNAVGTPDGTVGFYDGATLLGSGTLSAGTATYATGSLAVGAHSITAVYAGSANFVGATSSVQSETVTASAISLPSSVALGTITLSQGGTGKTQFTIGSLGTLNGAITLTCSGLPAGLGCQLSPSSVPLSTLPASVTVTINSTQVTTARNRLAPLGWALAMMLPGMLLMRRNRKLRMTLLAIALGLLLLGLASCGGGSSSTPVSNSYTPAGTYTGTITATSTGAVTTTTTFSVNLQQ